MKKQWNTKVFYLQLEEHNHSRTSFINWIINVHYIFTDILQIIFVKYCCRHNSLCLLVQEFILAYVVYIFFITANFKRKHAQHL